MPIAFESLNQILSHDFDTVIDVRSPAEFAHDHIPGAINLPAMSNEERAIVGTIYTQDSPFKARKIGAAIVARNVAHHLETALSEKDGRWRPLVYCWRGGQRSGSVATILKQIGWRAETVTGGYQSYRRLVHVAMYEAPLQHRLVLLDGNTGTAKTEILEHLKALGVQIFDLEGFAHHRGSNLGAFEDDQPSQKHFESELSGALAQFDPTRPVVVEAESSKIGKIILPPMLWEAMIKAPRIELAAPLDARAAYLAERYSDITRDPERFRDRLQPLRQFRSHALVDHWEELLTAGDLHELARSLMSDHYDPAYTKARNIHTPDIACTISLDTLDVAGQRAAAQAIAEKLKSL